MILPSRLANENGMEEEYEKIWEKSLFTFATNFACEDEHAIMQNFSRKYFLFELFFYVLVFVPLLTQTD